MVLSLIRVFIYARIFFYYKKTNQQNLLLFWNPQQKFLLFIFLFSLLFQKFHFILMLDSYLLPKTNWSYFYDQYSLVTFLCSKSIKNNIGTTNVDEYSFERRAVSKLCGYQRFFVPIQKITALKCACNRSLHQCHWRMSLLIVLHMKSVYVFPLME